MVLLGIGAGIGASIWDPRDISSCPLGLLRRMDKILFISSWNRAGALACYGFEQQQRSSAQVASRSRNRTAVCE